MIMQNKLLIGLLVLIAGVGVGWYVLGARSPKQEGAMEKTENAMPVPGTNEVDETVVTTDLSTGAGDGTMDKGGVATKTVVTYTDSGFGPKEVTGKKGATVAFINESAGTMWVAS